eukprot:CAMPEP_0197836814 /NCGR_PEP_ID=MMETSP1437-20131217/30082_1 /TAXON_ID=49252 ORGANISM="Eucampia antarctica, Strain CCMP1452" /NCGR_SAMPLE_ID=MMETSP1437 /ASSEMBLY_ACC=CAM_ASM_001096 /LENGTH=124 /DNA_ID=CAMNT_0043443289 /DNA_START=8 /DNA_END=382 /DNA_ORIENTATION=+
MKFGMPNLKAAQEELGSKTRSLLNSKGLTSVAAPGFQAPGVLVYYSPAGVDNPGMMTKFKSHGLQIAMGVPWRVNEPEGLNSFRIGLFGLDKMNNISETVGVMENAIDGLLAETAHGESAQRVA